MSLSSKLHCIMRECKRTPVNTVMLKRLRSRLDFALMSELDRSMYNSIFVSLLPVLEVHSGMDGFDTATKCRREPLSALYGVVRLELKPRFVNDNITNKYIEELLNEMKGERQCEEL